MFKFVQQTGNTYLFDFESPYCCETSQNSTTTTTTITTTTGSKTTTTTAGSKTTTTTLQPITTTSKSINYIANYQIILFLILLCFIII